MNRTSYEQVIVAGIRNLSPERQREVADFVLFLRQREDNGTEYEQLIESDLAKLEADELKHLEEEFLPENKIVEIDARDVSETDSDKEKWLKEFDEWMNGLDPNTPNLTDEQISRESIYEEQLNRQR